MKGSSASFSRHGQLNGKTYTKYTTVPLPGNYTVGWSVISAPVPPKSTTQDGTFFTAKAAAVSEYDDNSTKFAYGIYTFRMCVTDNDTNKSKCDDVTWTLYPPEDESEEPEEPPEPPDYSGCVIGPVGTVNAGNDVTVSQGSTAIVGEGYSATGSCFDLIWSFISGPATPTWENVPGEFTQEVKGLTKKGTYIFRLTKSEYGGYVMYDDTNIIVN